MKREFSIKKLFICLSICLLSIINLPVNINAENQSLDIATAEDLLRLANNCSIDSYSKGLTFNITNDIDMAGRNFDGIPIFAGTLKGNNHTIKNVDIDSDHIQVGFIDNLLEGGEIDSLIVEGSLKANGEVRAIGGIVALNYGVVNNCTFIGKVENTDYVKNSEVEQVTGGIAGVNFESGTVSLCKAYGSVKGLKNTGGIVGTNLNEIIGCVNYANVNTAVRDKGGSIFKDLKIKSLKDISNLLSFKTLYASESTGGIAGSSTGSVYASENKGQISNNNNGYNVGGIVGQNSGFISNCNNTGNVYGNNNVGGIVGQLEPGVIVKYTDDIITKAKGDVDTMFDLVDGTLDDTTTRMSQVSSNVSSLLSSINKISKDASDIESAVTDVTDEEFARIGQAKNTLIDAVQVISNGVATIGSDTTTMTKYLTDGVNNVLDITNDISTFLFGDKPKPVNYTVRVKHAELIDPSLNAKMVLFRNGRIERTIDLVPPLTETESTNEAINTINVIETDGKDGTVWDIVFHDVFDLADAVISNIYYVDILQGNELNTLPSNIVFTRSVDLSSGANLCIEMLVHKSMPDENFNITFNWKMNDQPNSEAPDKFVVYVLTNVLVGMKVVDVNKNGEVPTSHQITISSEHGHTYTIVAKPYDDDINYNSSLGGLPNKMKNFAATTSYDSDIHDQKMEIEYTGGNSWGTELLFNLILLAGAVAGDLNEAITNFKGATSSLTNVSDDITKTMEKFNNESLPAIRRIELFKGLSDELDVLIDKFTDDVVGASNAINSINGSLNVAQSTIVNDIRDIVSQVNIISDSVFDIIYNAKAYVSSLVQDDSAMLAESNEIDFYSGLVLDCENRGTIAGKESVGGIAGAMDLSNLPTISGISDKGEKGLPSISYRAAIKNSYSDCAVKSSDGYAGIICGKQTLGTIVNCNAFGDVENKNNYTGGIAGYAHGLIKNCTFNGTLSGKNYIGGIAGTGSDKEFLIGDSLLSNNYALVKIENADKFKGAISGNYAGKFTNNYFYSDDIKGVSSYSLEGEFAPLSKKAIESKVNNRNNYVYIRYVASGKVVDEYAVNCGSSFDTNKEPKVPTIPGLVGFWLRGDINHVNSNKTINAFYLPNPIVMIVVIVLVILIIIINKKILKQIKNSKKLNEQ